MTELDLNEMCETIKLGGKKRGNILEAEESQAEAAILCHPTEASSFKWLR